MTCDIKEKERRHWRSKLGQIEQTLGYCNKTMPLRQKRRFQLFIKTAGLKEGLDVLEIGCGTGNFTQGLAQSRAHIVAIDLSPELLELARKKTLANVEYKIADAEKLPFADESFDIIAGNSVLHHCHLPTVLREIKRVLKDGGRIIFSEPNMLNPHVFLQKNIKFLKKLAGDSPNETAFFRWKLKKALKDNGFTGIRIEPFDFLYPMIPSFLIPLANKICLKIEGVPLLKEIAGSLIISATASKHAKKDMP